MASTKEEMYMTYQHSRMQLSTQVSQTRMYVANTKKISLNLFPMITHIISNIQNLGAKNMNKNEE